MKSATFQLTIALAILFGAFGLYGAGYAAVSVKSASVASLENQIRLKTEEASRIAAARTALAEIAGDEATVQGYFVPETAVVPFIDSLEGRGRTLGTTVNVLSVANSPDAAHESLAISLSVRGPFDAVMRTIGSIEYAPYDLTLTALALTEDAKGQWQAQVSLLVGSSSSAPAPQP